MDKGSGERDLPGFRFHPTEDELIDCYLKELLYGKKFHLDIIGTLNIYRHDPWELPDLARIGEREWYFFVPRDRKRANGGRPNRTTENGFWKATGSDRRIFSAKDPKRIIGLKKTLVFHKGRGSKGCKTDWVMNEYRMPDNCPMPKEDFVLCKIYRKATSLKVLEQRAMEEDLRTSQISISTVDLVSSSDQETFQAITPPLKEQVSIENKKNDEKENEVSSERLGWVKENLTELQMPKYSLEWMQDPFLLRSPWLGSWTPYANVLNFSKETSR